MNEELPDVWKILRLIVSIISSSGRRSVNVWHVSASVDMRQSRLNEWWNEARWEKNKTASTRKKKKKNREWDGRKKKNCNECQAKSQESAPFHPIVLSIPHRRREVTLQWPWNYWFHRAKSAGKCSFPGPDKSSSVIIVFWGCDCIHLVVFIFVWQFANTSPTLSPPTPDPLPPRNVTRRLTELQYVRGRAAYVLFFSAFNRWRVNSVWSMATRRGHRSLVRAGIDMQIDRRAPGDITPVLSSFDWFAQSTKVRITIFDLHSECAPPTPPEKD